MSLGVNISMSLFLREGKFFSFKKMPLLGIYFFFGEHIKKVKKVKRVLYRNSLLCNYCGGDFASHLEKYLVLDCEHNP